MAKWTDKGVWDGWDAVLVGGAWALLLHPFLGLIMGMIALPKNDRHNKMSRGAAVVESAIATLILIGISLSSFHYQLEDVAPPGPIRDLKANATTESIGLTWVAAGDDEFKGSAETALKFSDKPILRQDRAINSDQMQLQYSNARGGQQMKQELALCPSGEKRTFYFQINTWDDHGKAGPAGEISVEVPASRDVIYENHGTGDWAGEGKWKSQGRIDTSFIALGDCWACQFYEPNSNDSLTGPTIALPEERPAELLFHGYANLGEGDKVFLECSVDGTTWETLATFEGWEFDIGIQTFSLSKWQGRKIQLRFRMVSDQTREGRGFAFDDLCVRLRDESENEEPEPENSSGDVKETEQNDQSRNSEDGSKTQ